MSTTSRNISASQDGSAYTSDLNSALAALDTCHSGSSAPTNQVLDGKLWLDTSGANPVLKIYRGAWVPLFTVTSGGVTVAGTIPDNGHSHTIANVTGLQTELNNLATSSGSLSQDFNADTLNINSDIDFGDWTVEENAGKLYFKFSGTSKMSLDSSGNLTVTGNVQAYGSP